MASYIGFEEHDGIFCPGGSMANMYGMHIARHHHFPQVKVNIQLIIMLQKMSIRAL